PRHVDRSSVYLHPRDGSRRIVFGWRLPVRSTCRRIQRVNDTIGRTQIENSTALCPSPGRVYLPLPAQRAVGRRAGHPLISALRRDGGGLGHIDRGAPATE